jgi:opacity protein-like surface antigen
VSNLPSVLRSRVLVIGLPLAIAGGSLLAAPSTASADGILGAFVGRTFGGQTEESTIVYGGVLGGVRPRGLGFEIDFGYSPDFYDTEDVSGVKTSITTIMGNLVFGGAAARGVAPYISGGVGLIRANVSEATELLDELTANDFGLNVGGGVNVMFSSNVGVRGDLRYFRSLASEDDDDDVLDFGLDLSEFDFWRGTVGLVLRW